MAVTKISKKVIDGLGASFDQSLCQEASGKAAAFVYIADATGENAIKPPTHDDVIALAQETGNILTIKNNTAPALAGVSAPSGLPVQGMTDGVPIPVSSVATSSLVLVTPGVTSNGAYSAGNEIGGLMTFGVDGNGGGRINSARVTSKSILTTALKLFLFTVNPSNSTWADKTAPAINSADVASLLGWFSLPTADSSLGTCTIWDALNVRMEFTGLTLYGVLVCVSSATLNVYVDFRHNR